MLELVTMTDLRFLPQSLTLHRSLVTHATRFKLTVLCMDAASHRFLCRQNLPQVRLLELAELERADPALAATRSRGTWTEYCWTVTPALCCHVLERATGGAPIVWIDADIEFLRDPALLVDELADGSVLLTPHRFHRAYPTAAPAAYLTAHYGRFNGGTLVFRHDEQGLAAARLWRTRTLAWCHDRCEPGRYGNQLHLDDFPQRFSRARVLSVPGGILGPWNGGRFRVRGSVEGASADGRPVLAYHYQSLRLGHSRPGAGRRLSPNVFALPGTALRVEARAQPHYRLSHSERERFWRPHAIRLGQAVSQVVDAEPGFLEVLAPPPARADVLEAVRLGLTLRASRYLRPFCRALRWRIISAVGWELAGARRRRARQPR
jgi:hypothetical protein